MPKQKRHKSNPLDAEKVAVQSNSTATAPQAMRALAKMTSIEAEECHQIPQELRSRLREIRLLRNWTCVEVLPIIRELCSFKAFKESELSILLDCRPTEIHRYVVALLQDYPEANRAGLYPCHINLSAS